MITLKRLLQSLCMSLVLVVGVSNASEIDALSWLSNQQNATDGSIYLTSDISNIDQSTAETVRALQLATETSFNVDINSALSFLETFSIDKSATEHLSRTILVKTLALEDSSAELAELELRQNSDGGFGDYQGYDSTVLSTAFALSVSSLPSTGNVSSTVSFLANSQNGDGSWSLSGSNDPSVELTAYTMNALWQYRKQFNVASNLSAAQAYLESQTQNPSELWGTTEQSALSLIALTQNAVDRSPYQISIDNLLNQQLANGSVENDVYLTALISRLIQIVESPADDAISISGRILDADSGLSLPNVDVRLSGNATQQTTTNANGQFLIVVPSAGQYSLNLSLEGYSEAILQTNLQTGEQRQLNDVVLTKLAIDPETGDPILTGTIRGTINASIDNSPLPSVTVTVSGQPELSAISDDNGDYLISNVPSGTVSVIASLDGYQPKVSSAQLANNQTLIFSPTLTQVISNTISVFGVITEAESGLPLENVNIIVSQGGDQFSALTDSTGMYQISDIPSGAIQISTSLTGYLDALGELDAPNGANVDFSPSLTLEGQTPTTKAGALKARVIDRLTGQALNNIDVVLTYIDSGDSFLFNTSSGGFFEITNLPLGAATLALSSPDYDSEILDIEVLDSVSLDLGIVSLLPIDANAESSVSGVVVNSVTNEPLTDVIISLGAQNILSGQNGGFEFSSVTAGEVSLMFAKENFRTVDFSIVTSAGQAVDLAQIRMRPEEVEVLLPDLSVTGLNKSNLSTNLQTLGVSGDLIVDMSNLGTQRVNSQVELVAFKDSNGNNDYDLDMDEILGEAVFIGPVDVNAAQSISIPLAGTLSFRDAPIHVKVDSNTVVIESDEDNNVRSTADECRADLRCNKEVVPLGTPKVKWAWTSSTVLPTYNQVMMTPLVAQANDDNGDGIIDTADVPDVIFTAHAQNTPSGGEAPGIIRIVSGATGEELTSFSEVGTVVEAYGNLAVGDIDSDGEIEIIAPGFTTGVYAFELDGSIKWHQPDISKLFYGGATLADLDGNGQVEVAAGGALLDGLTGNILWQGGVFEGQFGSGTSILYRGSLPVIADINLDGVAEVIYGGTVHNSNGDVLWQNIDSPDGLSGVGNFDEDNFAELVIVRNGFITLADHTGETIWRVAKPDGGEGGAPTIADYDSDGEPEIGVAGSLKYTVFDTDGSVLWEAATFDTSSRVTGSSLFDFNNDDVPEVVYADERNVHIFDGPTGETIFELPHSSATTYEYPVIADIDNDGHAEIVVAQNNVFRPGPTPFNGIRVIEEENDSWVGTRGIWNQHAYSIDNVNDDGTIPTNPEKGWLTHNTFRLNAFPQCVDQPSFSPIGGELVPAGESLPGIEIAEGYAIEVFASNVTSQQGPSQLAFNSQGDLFLALGDSGISKIPAGTNVPESFGATNVSDSDGLAVDSQDNVIVSGSPVTKYAPDGSVLWEVGCPAGNLQLLSVDDDGNVYVGSLGSSICKISSDGQMVETIGGFSQPSEPSDSRDGLIYIGQLAPKNIAVVSLEDATIVDILPIGFFATQPVFDVVGHLHVGKGVGSLSTEAAIIDLSDNSVTTIASGFRNARGRAYGPDGNLYIADSSTNIIYKITLPEQEGDQKSDLSLSQLSIAESGVNQPFTLSARVGNGGALPSLSNIELTFYKVSQSGERTLLAQRTLEVLEEGEFTDITISGVTGLAAGDRIIAIVDEANNLKECDETNNVMNIAVGVINGNIDISTDKPSYLSNEPVLLTNSIRNTSNFSNAYQVLTRIEDANGELVTEFASQLTGLLQSDTLIEQTLNWNTATNLAGTYVAVSVLRDLDGNQIAEDQTSFTIVSEGVNGLPNITLRTTTDRRQYHVNDSVEIDDLVRNVSVNGLERAASLQVSVTAPSGGEVFNTSQPIGDLTPSFSKQVIDLLELSDAEMGDYQVTGMVLSASGAMLATDSSVFEVVNDLNLTITGSVTASVDEVFIGESLVCADKLVNTGLADIADLPIRQLLLNVDAGELVTTLENNVSLVANSELELSPRNIETNGLVVGNYSCALQAFINNEWMNLDNDFFEVLEQPIKIDLETITGTQGRVLILLDDDQSYSTSGSEPDLAAQRTYLENLLTQAGWFYTIVTSGADFVSELQTGAYINYLLLSEAEKVSEQGQKELREAIFRGEGLIEAGSHDQRQGRVDDALGVKFKGKSNNVQGLSLFDSDLSVADNLTLLIPDSVLTAELEGATKLAEYIPDLAKGNKPAPPAITEFEHGDGQSVYFGFDVLAEATLLNSNDSVFAQLILNALTQVNNADLLDQTNVSKSIQLIVSNEQQATPARLILTIPEGVTVDYAPEGIVDGNTVTWLLDLAEQETVIAKLWLSSSEPTIVINAQVDSGEDPDWVLQAEAQLTLTQTESNTLDQVLGAIPSDKSWKQIRQTLERAQGYLDQANWSSALRELLKASDKLATSSLPGVDDVRIQVAQVIRSTEQSIQQL